MPRRQQLQVLFTRNSQVPASLTLGELHWPFTMQLHGFADPIPTTLLSGRNIFTLALEATQPSVGEVRTERLQAGTRQSEHIEFLSGLSPRTQ